MRRVIPLLFTLTLVAGACGGDGAVTTAAPTDTTLPPGAVTRLEDVRGAVIQIVARGSFMDPIGGAQVNVPGVGSGFIISRDGLAVTNNHVVTGAAIIDVWVQGYDRPLNATVVAASECSDLAVIQLAGDGFPYLQWHDGAVVAGTQIYAAGFPLGDPEYTLLNGIVSKERVDGESSWASVDAVIEHTAATLPGNSGGPIVTADGRVLGVNFAGNDLGQRFAIGIDVARPMIDRLTAGADIEAIGVNGEATSIGAWNGIWVYSVKSGSPADLAGIQSGDLIVSLESLRLADDGTMADYCDILRSRRSTDVLAIDVYRQGTSELLRGQINGRALEVITSFAADFGDDKGDDPNGAYTEYMWISDDDNLIEVSVPVEWSDVFTGPWPHGGNLIGTVVQAAPNLELFHQTWGTPGVFVGASSTLGLTPREMLDQNPFNQWCDSVTRHDYDDGVYRGLLDFYSECGTEGAGYATIAAQLLGDLRFIIYVQIVIVSDRDLAAADQVLATLMVNLPGQGGGNDNPPPPGTGTYTYSPITDDSGAIEMSVPDQWSDVISGTWQYNGSAVGRYVSASPNLDLWASTWGTPGVFVGVSPLLAMSPGEILDGSMFDDECDYVGRFDYDDGLYVGLFDWYENCGNEGSEFYVGAAQPPDSSFLVYLQVVIVTDADLAALDEIIRTFVVLGNISP